MRTFESERVKGGRTIDCKDYVTGIGNGSRALIAIYMYIPVETLPVVTSRTRFWRKRPGEEEEHHKAPLHYTQVTVEG